MKKYRCLFTALAVFVLVGCKAADVPATPEEPLAAPLSSQVKNEKTPVELKTLLADIWNAAPGTAGSALKQAKAAGELLDWAQAGNAADAGAVERWLSDTKYAPGDMARSFAAVLNFADRVLQGDAEIAAQWEEAGYVPLYDRYDAGNYHAAARSLSPLFTQILDQCAANSTGSVHENPTAYDKTTLDRVDGIWCDGAARELLVILGGKCRVVIPYLGELGDTAYAVRVRDRSDLGYCPALEVDIHGAGDFSGPLTYYVTGVDETHFWSNTQGQRFEKIPTD
ncbi:hypothetical protein [Oscillibacter sp.]|uniref:hypothetical protein n=1 Tax=Oscillibacter sp. TaxID=1945593 RepID=UPI002604C578|nr:hypothetical protein [Oscillibacter sp.]MDD3346065.1 hypothetical protein [Oscillibacter sp.]